MYPLHLPHSHPRPCSKSDQGMWQFTVNMVDKHISEVIYERVCENMQACLGWLKEYDCPAHKNQIWAFDGVVRCQKTEEAFKFPPCCLAFPIATMSLI